MNKNSSLSSCWCRNTLYTNLLLYNIVSNGGIISVALVFCLKTFNSPSVAIIFIQNELTKRNYFTKLLKWIMMVDKCLYKLQWLPFRLNCNKRLLFRTYIFSFGNIIYDNDALCAYVMIIHYVHKIHSHTLLL